MTNPVLGRDKKFMEDCVKYQERHVRHMKRCIMRTIAYQGNFEGKRYMGCIMNWGMYPDLMRKVFPKAKVIFCIRDPTGCVPSLVDLTYNIAKHTSYDKELTFRMENWVELYTKPVYEGMANI